MKILTVCQYYHPEDFQITPVCEQLVKDGHDVTVLTGLPNYPKGIIPKEYKKRKHRNEIINGVHVIRCCEFGRKKGVIRLALNYLSFYFFSMRKIKRLEKDFDLVFVYQLSPILMGLPGVWYAKRYQKPLLLYCCDLWPESIKIYIKNENNLIFKRIRKISFNVYNAANRIIVQSKSFISYLLNEHNIPLDKIKYIPTFADDSYLDQDFTHQSDDFLDVVFMGNVGNAQGLSDVIEAIGLASKSVQVRLHIVGDGACLESLKKQVKENGLNDFVIFYGRRPMQEMPDYYRMADACLVSLKADSCVGFTLPSKVQGYMAAGKTIIGMIDGSAQEIIKESNCGICVNAGDVDGLAKVFVEFAQNIQDYISLGLNGKQFFIDNFSKSKHMKALETEFDLLANNNSGNDKNQK